jgi:hypothetical protein
MPPPGRYSMNGPSLTMKCQIYFANVHQEAGGLPCRNAIRVAGDTLGWDVPHRSRHRRNKALLEELR